MKKRSVALLLAFTMGIVAAIAQDGKTIIKLNLSSIVLNNYSLQYERVLNNRQSIGMAISVSPNTDLPFKKTLMDKFGDNEDAKRAIESTKFNKITITPEYRFYLSKKGAPQGFYLAPFARYTHMNIEQDYTFTPSSGIEHTARLKGKFDGVGGGLLIGSQWALGKNVTLDWWIMGPFVGVMNAEMDATDNMSDMTADDKAELERDIEDIDIPLWKIDATVGNNSVNAKLTGPFYGIRAFGLNLGIRF